MVQEDQVHLDPPLNTITQADAPRNLSNRDTLKAPERFGVPVALLADAGPDTYDEAMSSSENKEMGYSYEGRIVST